MHRTLSLLTILYVIGAIGPGDGVRPTLVLSRGASPLDSPTRSLAGPFAGALHLR